ncbi:UNVERIFIED_CONTAM: hypothetical protein PYX00_000496 [Menopon gallinae]|uniref:Prominin-like protein n=1 Tax=Menopon gallinae TaxID=328185 RepID=A0AAW2IAG6_9NEOP
MKFLLLLTVLVLVEAGDDDTADVIKKRMKLIGGIQNYGRQNGAVKLEQAPEENDIDYTEPKLNTNYTADAKFNPLGMGHLYYVTKVFLNMLEGDNVYPDELTDISNLTLDTVQKKLPEWLNMYREVVAVCAVGIVFIVIMPIAALLFCCCRCGGRCGAGKKQEKQRDPCKRVMIATTLSGVAVIMLFGVVCAFVTNEHLTVGIDKLVPNTKSAVRDSVLYLNNTNVEIGYLLVENFKQLKENINNNFGNAGDLVKNQLASASRAVALSNLTAIVNGMEIVKQDLAGIRETTLKLQTSTLSLNDDLDVLRQELLGQLRNCITEPACRHLIQQHHITELRVAQNFSELPDITQTFATISNLLGDNNAIDSIQRKVLDGQKNFDNIKYQISRVVQDLRPDVNEKIEKIEHRLEECRDDFGGALERTQKMLEQLSSDYLDHPDEYVKLYSPYRYYLGLGVSAALLLILLCLTLGLLCGICGKRPEEMYSEDTDCCNTIAGGKFLMLAVWLSFLLGSVLMLITFSHFLVGIILDMGVCKPLNAPTTNKLFKVVDSYVNTSVIYNGKDVDYRLSQIINECHRNESIYKTLKLDIFYDIDKLQEELDKNNFEDQIKRLRNRFNVRTDDVVLLDPEAKVKLINLARSPLNDIQFDKYAELLSLQVTKINLTQLSSELFTNADKLPPHSSGGHDLSNIKKFLRTKARYLRILQNTTVAEIQNEINVLKSNVSNLKEHLKFNHTSLHDAIVMLLNETENAQLYLRKNGSAEMRALIQDHLNENLKKLENYVHRVIEKIKTDIGRCGPMSNVFNATKVAVCNRVLDPFNGFWASVGWSVLLFIPAIILSTKLSALYTKSEAYGPPGMYGEKRVGKKKSRHRNYHESYDNSGNGSYLQDYSVHLGRTDRSSGDTDVRYNDMAPKHWNDSRGSGNGPPRYHHPPSMEYERPPPYYFPGPGERS